MRRDRATSEARTRVLETADRLFYEHGIRAVGVDRIIAEAGVAKMTLYSHFPSKDELILAVLKHREEVMAGYFRAAIGRHLAAGGDKLRALFAAVKELLATPGFRGCPFQNAAAELADPAHPAAVFVRDQKQRFFGFLRRCVEESVGPAGAVAVPAVSLLLEGAFMTAVIQGSAEPADVARDAAMKLIALESA